MLNQLDRNPGMSCVPFAAHIDNAIFLSVVGDCHKAFTRCYFSPAEVIIDLLSREQMLLPRIGEHGSVFASVIMGAKNDKVLIKEKFSALILVQQCL